MKAPCVNRRSGLPRYVNAVPDRKTGHVFYYFRRRGSACNGMRLPGVPWSTPFMAAYQQALDAAPAPIGITRTLPGSLDAAIVLYYPSKEFRALKSGVQAKYRASLERWREDHGSKPLRILPPGHIEHMLETMTPHAARNWLKAVRGFCKFCVRHKLIKANPTLGIRAPVPEGSHHTWRGEEEIERYRAAYPLGSKARLALELGYCTAQRRSDVIRMGRQHIKDGAITIKQEKTGTPVTIPILPELQAALDAMPGNHLTLLTTKSDKSYGANDFSEQFRKWCDDAGLPEICVFHGLRHAALTRLAEAGCTDHELMAIGGFKSIKMVQRYTKEADRKRLARTGMARLQNQGAAIPLDTGRRTGTE